MSNEDIVNMYGLPTDERNALFNAVVSVYSRHDLRMPLNHVNVSEWMNAIIEAGFRKVTP